MSVLQTCCEICTPEDMDEIDRTFEERKSEELAIIGQLRGMGVDPLSFCDDLPQELSQKCLDLIVDGHKGPFQEIRDQAEAELGKTFPDARVKDFVPEKEGRHGSRKGRSEPPERKRDSKKEPDRRKEDYHENKRRSDGKNSESRQPSIPPDRLRAISKNFGGEIPQSVLDKLNNPKGYISKEDWDKLPGIVKGTLIEMREDRFDNKQASVSKEPYRGDMEMAVEIVVRHAFEKHKLRATTDPLTKESLGPHGLYNEFPGEMRTVEQMKQEVGRILLNPAESKKLSGGREIYYDDKYDAVVVINHNHPNKCTFFQPATPDEENGGIRFGKQYFDKQR